VRILIDKHPYGAGYGEVGATWNVVKQKCNDLQNENGQKLFIPELQDVTTLQGRMKNYTSFTKKHQQMVPCWMAAYRVLCILFLFVLFRNIQVEEK
jgi:hypothetical protein